jgi:hypothetical protein
MFRPADQPMERGWVGRIDGDHVVHLAAQTLEAFFTGGGMAREHAVYPLDRVQLLAPVLRPPAVRIFESERSFAFANPAAILGPDSEVHSAGVLPTLLPRLAAVIGGDGEIAGFTALADWRRLSLPAPKDRDFALGLGPAVVTSNDAVDGPEAVVRLGEDEVLRGRFDGFEWAAAHDLAAEATVLRPGDILAGPPLGVVEGSELPGLVELEVEGVGTFRQTVLRT